MRGLNVDSRLWPLNPSQLKQSPEKEEKKASLAAGAILNQPRLQSVPEMTR